MKRISVFFIFFIAFAYILNAQTSNCRGYKDNVIIVKMKSEFKNNFMSDTEFKRLVEMVKVDDIKQMFPHSQPPQIKFNAYGQKMSDISNIYQINVGVDVEYAIKLFANNKLVEYVEPLYNVELLYVPDDPLNQTDQYWLTNIKAYEAWNIHQGDTNIVIGISDTGIDLGHVDLIGNIKTNYNDLPNGIDDDLDGFVDNFRGWNFAENNNNAQADVSSHGVWVSGIAGAVTDNGIGVSGAGFKCKILPLKIMNSEGMLENAYQSIVYAADHNVDVINCSWGGTYYQRMAQDVVDYAVINHDMLVVSAAGNTNSKTNYYPASYRNVLSVAGTNPDDERYCPENSPSASGSSYSYHVDVSAPATMFKSTTNGSGYAYMYGGTSFAAPIVAGCAGILRAAFPDYNANQIAELLKISADLIDTITYNVPFTGMLGTGRVNLYNALTIEPTPSIVLQNYSFVELENTVSLDLEFVNFLSDAENLTININTDSQFATINNSSIFSGNLATLESYLSEGQVEIYLDENTPKDHLLKLSFNYQADGYISKQIIEINVNPSYKNITTPKLLMSVAANGRIGYSDVNSTIGEGIVFKDYFQLMYDFGIISGTSATDVISSVRQSTDFLNVDYPEHIQYPLNSDNQISLKINDTKNVTPKGIEIMQNTYTWNDSEKSNFIIIEFSLVNTGLENINGFYFGLFTDWDLINPANNSSVLNQNTKFLYCKNNGVESMYAGVKLLTNGQTINYSLSQTEDGDNIVDITDGFADIEKFYMISNSSDQLAIDTDVVQSTSTGPLDILAGDTVVVGFAIIADDNIYEFEQGIEQAQTVYDQVLHPNSIVRNDSNMFSLFPNPASNKVLITAVDNCNNEIRLNVYNMLGELVFTEVFQKSITIDVSRYSSGLYNFEIISSKETFVEKVFVVN
ncbi:MAG: S8 family serine peptidase [Bacteroidales bacterium]|nr:S8 family serine peptidase [Bacteroidales bacterium]MDD4218362.1 S8 family serine peptidase [Bacteroidales bacterium]MDY0142617.1 S8 family serine peptidase [Bacteroidales bacterium]